MKNPAARIAQLIALAVSAQAIGSHREAQAATCGAARIAHTCGVDIRPIADAANLSLLCTIPWTEEAAPRGVMFTGGPSIECADGTFMIVYTAEDESGIMIERIASDADDFHYLGRGFWRDCEMQEAVWFAREAWGC